MFPPHRRANSALPFRAAFVLALALALTACQPPPEGEAPAAPIDSALFSSLPIAQPEGASVADLLSRDTPSHWAVDALAARGDWRALDWLGGRADRRQALAEADLLIMAQPRPLAPEENVALDEYVRGGGSVLLFADPELTQESLYPLGDKRRPLHGVLLSPILARWGLALERDDKDRAKVAEWNGVSLPLARAGRFRLVEDGGEFAGQCTLQAEARLVACRIGEGRVVALADAALLEADMAATAETRAALFDRLIDSALQR